MSAEGFHSSRILNRHFLALKESDGLSLRHLAKLCNVSAGFLSQVLNSKKLVSRRLATALAEALDLDAVAASDLLNAHARDVMAAKGLNAEVFKQASGGDVREVITNDQVLLKSWLHLALLESSGCGNFTEDTAQLAKRFSVSASKVRQAIEDLVHNGYLVRDSEGQLKKCEERMRIPTNRSRAMVRDFHGQMMKQAISHMATQTEAGDFNARLITGYTVAVNPENIEQAKLILHKALIEISELLCQGDCTRVYQLQAQLFPLDK